MRGNTGLLRMTRVDSPQHVSTQRAICAVVGARPRASGGGQRRGRRSAESQGTTRHLGRWRDAGDRHGLAGVRVSQTCRKGARQQRSNHARSLGGANDARRSSRSPGVASWGSARTKCREIRTNAAGDRSVTASPDSRQAGLRRRDRGKRLVKRVCGARCKDCSSRDQDHAKDVRPCRIWASFKPKDRRRSHTLLGV